MFLWAMFGVGLLGVPIRFKLFLIQLIKMDCKFGFEMSLIVVEAIRGQSASLMILTAKVWEIVGGQTRSSILFYRYSAGSPVTFDHNLAHGKFDVWNQ